MLNAILFDIGNTVLSETLYDLTAGYDSISAYIDANESVSTLQNDITLGQRNHHEFSVLEWIEAHLSDTEVGAHAQPLEFKLWDKTVSLEPMSDIEEVLSFLRSKSIRVAALSNAIFSSKCISRELEMHNLAEYFEFVVSSADIGVQKPHRLAFEKCLNLFELSSSEVCYVGDSWTADVSGARSANILPIHFGRNANESGIQVEHFQLNNWSDFDGLWAALSNSNK